MCPCPRPRPSSSPAADKKARVPAITVMSRVVSRLACSHALAGMTLLVAFDLGCGSSGGGVSGGGSGGAAVGTGGTSSGTGGSGSGGTSATGGSVGTGGTSQTGGMAGHASTGGGAGRAATGGGGGVGGASGPLTPQAAAMLMSPGWNLGNSFDSAPNETSYGNPTPTQTLINAVHA